VESLADDTSIIEIPLENIIISKDNARTLDLFSGLDELADSIREIGLQQPVVVFPITGKEGKFELIIGQRRFLAYRNILKEKKTIPAIVLKKPMNNVDALAYSFSENIHRQDLDVKDRITVAMKLLRELGEVKSVAKKLNVSETTIRNYLGWAAVPEEIKALVESKKISKQTAMRISKTNNDPARAIAIAKQVIEAPRREERNAIIQTSIDHPAYGPDEIAVEAKKVKFKHITLDLTDAAANALERASTKYEIEPSELATQVIVEYLKNEGFYE
jgi:ParB family chromosome partitioning protein